MTPVAVIDDAGRRRAGQRGRLIKLDLTWARHVAAPTPKRKVSNVEADAARQHHARGRRRILVRRIDAVVAADNAKSHPFTWTATADEILAKVAKICNVIFGTQH